VGVMNIAIRARAVMASLLFCGVTMCGGGGTCPFEPEQETEETEMASAVQQEKFVTKYTLDNGMTVLVRPVHTVPKVSIQLWYGVGSRDERDGERGLAHLIEHMIFKGTETLSESDINVVTHTLSGNCNAFTSYDYTGYLFNFPTRHWKEALPIMADCMRNASFKDQMLNSEMKAVIQELKMYRDQHLRSLMEGMVSTIFADHPYHHPIIGYKQDLWTVRGDDLKRFFKKHYSPDNATLVVVGDVEPEEVRAAAQQYFGHIKPEKPYERRSYYHNKDIAATSLTYYRDVQQPALLYAYVIPGSKEGRDNYVRLLEWIVGRGRSSRLYKKLVNELQLVTSVQAGADEMFDHSIFFVICEPKSVDDADRIARAIQDEFDDIAANGPSELELERALRQGRKELYELMESNQDQAGEIGRYYLATGDEDFAFTSLEKPADKLAGGVRDMVAENFRMPVMHRGSLLPLPESEKPFSQKLQTMSDAEDEEFISKHPRTLPVEPAVYAKGVKPQEFKKFDFPKAEQAVLENGVKVFSHHNATTPKVDIILDLKAKHYYDPWDKQGVLLFLSKMLNEGTKNYPGEAFADAIEARGITLSTYAGGIMMSLLREDLPFGLEVLYEVVTEAQFGETEIEKVRAQILAALRRFWDTPLQFSGQLIRERIYGDHPYAKNSLGSVDVVQHMTRKDLLEYYRKFVTPDGARISIVGDIGDYDLLELLNRSLGRWQGPELAEPEFPAIEPVAPQILDYPINRDQIVLSFAGLSIKRKDPLYDQLLLFDQIFGGGALRSMSSRLFELREQTGLFYTIAGSVIAGSGEQPGMTMVRTIVTPDDVADAEKRIRQTIDDSAKTITPEELREARDAVSSAIVSSFASNAETADAFLFLDKYKLPADYFDTRSQQLAAITIPQVQEAVGQILGTDKMLEMRVGRIDGMKTRGIRLTPNGVEQAESVASTGHKERGSQE